MLLRAVRHMLRFLADPGLDQQSPYMRASAARDLIQTLERDLRVAEVAVPTADLAGEEFWEGFAATVEGALEALRA